MLKPFLRNIQTHDIKQVYGVDKKLAFCKIKVILTGYNNLTDKFNINFRDDKSHFLQYIENIFVSRRHQNLMLKCKDAKKY